MDTQFYGLPSLYRKQQTQDIIFTIVDSRKGPSATEQEVPIGAHLRKPLLFGD